MTSGLFNDGGGLLVDKILDFASAFAIASPSSLPLVFLSLFLLFHLSKHFLEDFTSASVWLVEFGCHCTIQRNSEHHHSPPPPYRIMLASNYDTQFCLQYICSRKNRNNNTNANDNDDDISMLWESTCCLHLIFGFQTISLSVSFFIGRFEDLFCVLDKCQRPTAVKQCKIIKLNEIKTPTK